MKGYRYDLDDLFALAAQKFILNRVGVTVRATVTTNHTDGVQTTTNTAAVQPALLLTFVPGGEVKIGGFPEFFPPSFQSNELTITAPRPSFHGSDTYGIDWQGNAFAANVDGTTNIVYGPAGQQFITISLCDLLASEVTQ